MMSAEQRLGLAAAFGAYLLWGLLPLFIKIVGFASPTEVLAHRILWSMPAGAAAILFMGGFAQGIRALRGKGVLRTLALSAFFIAVNWYVYLWAVANDRIIEASLAYFVAPLVTVAVGVFFFGERLGRLQLAALSLAALGVAVQGLALGRPPWLVIALCGSWCFYAALRKQAPVPAAAGLFVETLFLAVPAGITLLVLSQQGPLAFTQGPQEAALLMLAGPLTAAPLILFAFAARRISFATLGLIQYMTPSMQLFLGVAFGEPLTTAKLGSFALIWIGLAIYSYSVLRGEKPHKQA